MATESAVASGRPLSKANLLEELELLTNVWNIATLSESERQDFLATTDPEFRDSILRINAADDSCFHKLVTNERFRIFDWQLLGEDGPDGAVVEPHLLLVALALKAGGISDSKVDGEGVS